MKRSADGPVSQYRYAAGGNSCLLICMHGLRSYNVIGRAVQATIENDMGGLVVTITALSDAEAAPRLSRVLWGNKKGDT